MSKIATIKKERYESLIKDIISATISQEVYDPIIQLATVHAIVLNNDKSIAKVYIGCYDKSMMPKIISKINQASGFFRTKLARELNLRKAPSIIFLNDDTIDKFDEIESIIKQVKG